MPHDKNGRAIVADDTVAIQFRVLTVHATENDCNLDLIAIGDAKQYLPTLALNASLVVKQGAFTAQEMGGALPALVANTKQLRKDVDAVLLGVKAELNGTFGKPWAPAGMRELAVVRTKLEEAIMWAGMRLKEINEVAPGLAPDPYPQSKNPQSPVVEPTADGVLGNFQSDTRPLPPVAPGAIISGTPLETLEKKAEAAAPGAEAPQINGHAVAPADTVLDAGNLGGAADGAPVESAGNAAESGADGGHAGDSSGGDSGGGGDSSGGGDGGGSGGE